MRVLHCRDAGFDCDAVVRGNSDDEVLGQATEHAKDVHGVEASPQMANQLKGLIRNE